MTESAKAKAESAKAKKAAETRESIVNVCIRMFAERGFVSTSLDEAGAHLQARYSKGVTLHALLVELREAVLLRATLRRIGTA